MKRLPSQPESALRASVEAYLALRSADLLWTRTDAGSEHEDVRGRNVRSGWSDLTIVVRGGQVVLVELKRVGGRTRPGQRKHREAALKLGAVAIEARSVRDVHKALQRALERGRGAAPAAVKQEPAPRAGRGLRARGGAS